MIRGKRKKEIIIIILIIILFIIASYLSHKFDSTLNSLMFIRGWLGALVYVLVTMLAVLIAPVSTLPLLPIAVTLWGPNLAAVLSIVGWTIGSILAFIIARLYGRSLVSRFINIRKIEQWSSYVPKRNLFWMLVFVRMILPVDVVSYAVGLFTEMRWQPYLAATIIGITPFAFVFAYGSKLPLLVQVIAGSIILIFIVLSIYSFRKKFTNKSKS